MSAAGTDAQPFSECARVRFVRPVLGSLETERDWHEAFASGAVVCDSPAAERYRAELAAKFGTVN